MTATAEKIKRLLTVPQTAEKHIAFSQSALRHLIFDSDKNGFNKVIKRVGRKVLIDEEAFFDWIEEQQGGKYESA